MANDVLIKIKAVDLTKGAFRGITKAMGTVAGAAINLKTAFIGAAGVGGIGFLISRSLDATDALAKTANRIGTTTEALSRLHFAADLSGVSTETLNMAMQRFTRRTAEAARGTGEAKDAIRELGLNANDLLRLDLDEQMVKLADAFAGVKTDADKVRLAMKLFDSEGVALVQTLNAGSAGLREMFSEAEALGAVMSTNAAKGVEDTQDALTRLNAVMGGLRDQVVAALAPALESIVTSLTDMIREAGLAEGGFRQLANNIAASMVGAFVTVIEGSESMVNTIIKGINAIRKGIRAFQEFSGQGAIGAQAELRREQESLNASIADGTAQIERMRDAVREGKKTFGVGPTVDAILGDKARLAEVNEELAKLAPHIQALQDIPEFSVDDFTGGMLSSLQDLRQQLAEGFDLGETEGEGTKTQTAGVNKLQLAYEGATDAIKKFNSANDDVRTKMEDITTKTLASFSDALTNAVMGTGSLKDAFKSMIKNMIAQLIQFFIIDKLTGGIASALFRVKSVATGGGGASAISPTGKAIGGPVQSGQPYIVGERGPEMFVPNQSGSIIRNKKMGGGVTVINNVDARGSGADVDQKIKFAMAQSSQQTIMTIQDLMRRRRFV